MERNIEKEMIRMLWAVLILFVGSVVLAAWLSALTGQPIEPQQEVATGVAVCYVYDVGKMVMTHL